ncbi:MAG: citrate lyase holo-[Synergistaceae bacterium]|nr:citrate lyase holo-[acyl-carrier protein] synthase [Synergistaceae bacterium]
MTGSEITLTQMLARREARSRQQQTFLQTHRSPLVSFSMNIPGPIKTNPQIRKAFMLGRNLLFRQLNDAGAQILADSEIHEDTGDELLLAVGNIEPSKLKDIAVQIEEISPFGRLYDIDVLDAEGQKLSRPNFRKCLICDKQAQDCARSRTHSVKEMQNAIDILLEVII